MTFFGAAALVAALAASTCSATGANVVQADVAADNGVIHVVDTVLPP